MKAKILISAVSRICQYNWTRTVNAWKIDMGMFKGNFGQVINKWTYGFANSLIGNIVAHAYNTVGQIDGVSDLNGMLALSGATSRGRAFTIGHYSLGPKKYIADWRDNLFVHEYGHYIQSQWLGSAYLPLIAKPSLFSASIPAKWRGSEHNQRWFETNASKLGAEYFDRHYGSKATGWYDGSPDHFSMDTFHSGKYNNYSNPRYDETIGRGYPTSGHKSVLWDFIIW